MVFSDFVLFPIEMSTTNLGFLCFVLIIFFVYCIQIDFHDTGRGPRVPSMTDYFGFTMASLDENGSVFANPCTGEKNMSTLMYRPFSSWANNSEVRYSLFSIFLL